MVGAMRISMTFSRYQAEFSRCQLQLSFSEQNSNCVISVYSISIFKCGPLLYLPCSLGYTSLKQKYFLFASFKNIVGNISRVIGGNWPKAHDGHEAESLVCRSGADVQLKKNHKYLEKNQWNFQGR